MRERSATSVDRQSEDKEVDGLESICPRRKSTFTAKDLALLLARTKLASGTRRAQRRRKEEE